MRYMTDAASAASRGHKERDCSQDHDRVLRLHRKDKKQNGRVWKEHPEGQQEAINGARGSDRRYIGVSKKVRSHNDAHPRTSSTEKVISQKLPGTPSAFERHPN